MNLLKGTVNEVYQELTNVTTITPVYYIFQFINSSSNEEKIFYKSDSSTTISNYNLFLIEETATENLYDGKVSLESGQWTYKIYQSATSSLSLTYSTPAYNGNGYISSGFVRVKDEGQTQPKKHSPAVVVKKIHKPNG